MIYEIHIIDSTKSIVEKPIHVKVSSFDSVSKRVPVYHLFLASVLNLGLSDQELLVRRGGEFRS